MKAILIDPQKKEITEVTIERGLNALYKTIGCNMVEAPVQYPNGDVMYCDEEAWLHYEETMCGFMFPDWAYAILGKALIVGTTAGGNDRDCKSKVSDFSDIKWKTETQMYLQGLKMGVI